MRPQPRTLAALAAARHGVVTRRELLDAGLSPEAVKRLVRSGWLIVAHRGVYRVGHAAPSVEADYAAAVAACGPGALLCGLAAGWLFGLVRGTAPRPSVMARSERRIEGIDTCRCRRWTPLDAATYRGIPITTVARTLTDLAAELERDALARACHEAGVRFGTTPLHVDEVLARRPTTPGAGNLRAVLHGDVRVTLSALERRFLARLRAARLPLPQTNRIAGGYRVDCRWPERRLTVELDGYRYHRSRHAWEQDRRREREARARGDEFRRYTYGDVVEDPAYMLAELRSLLKVPGQGSPGDPGAGT
jgi:very-short-patch-repair endonuclease